MARSSSLDRLIDRFTFGGRVRGGVGLIIALTAATSLVAAFTGRHVLPVFELGALEPARVLSGEVWRLLSWVLLEPRPLSLVFACLLLYWFGGDLAELWGSRRLVRLYFGVALATAIGTCLVALLDADVLGQAYVGTMPLVEALTVAWGLSFPHRTVRIYFVLPIRGYVIAWGTVALTVILAIYSGWQHEMPSLLAEGTMLAWVFGADRRLLVWWRKRREAKREAQRRAEHEARKASLKLLRTIEESDAEPPPMPSEVEHTLGRILGSAGKKPKRDLN